MCCVEPVNGSTSTTSSSSSSSTSDTRAELLLDVMIGTLAAAPPPSLGHLLLGFDTTAPPQDWSRVTLDPRGEYSCMTVLLKVLQVMQPCSIKCMAQGTI
jgi:hypothetical protein